MLADLDLKDPASVRRLFDEGAEACLDARCREGSIDRIAPPGRLIATGDLHDNPVHLARLVAAAELDGDAPEPVGTHLTLHEIIHSDRLLNGMDFSYRALARVAALKAAAPERVHPLLANHELAQLTGGAVVKNGVRCVDAFDDALDHQFEDDAPLVRASVRRFIRAMPLALRCETPQGDILCAHSLPGPAMMGRFDPTVLERELTDEDIAARTGSAHMMVWGRKYDADQLEDLVERWGVNLFVLGHEHAPNGVHLVPPNAVVLNSDHERGVYLPIDLSKKPLAAEAVAMVVPLSQG